MNPFGKRDIQQINPVNKSSFYVPDFLREKDEQEDLNDRILEKEKEEKQIEEGYISSSSSSSEEEIEFGDIQDCHLQNHIPFEDDSESLQNQREFSNTTLPPVISFFFFYFLKFFLKKKIK